MYDVLEQSQRLQRLFQESFRVGQICEALVSFDAETSSLSVRQTLERRGFRIAGLREGGVTVGYLLPADLPADATPCGAFRREFAPEEIVGDHAPLADALARLADRDRLFVSAFGGVTGIVTWSDVQRPLVRMWLFGLVTLLEMAFTGLVEAFHPDDGWVRHLSPGRLKRAEELRAERLRLLPGGSIRRIDCLQLADKGQILLRDEETRRLLPWSSKEQGERALRRLGRLRDNLAHAQDIVTEDWPVILALAARLDRIIAAGMAFARPLRTRPERNS